MLMVVQEWPLIGHNSRRDLGDCHTSASLGLGLLTLFPSESAEDSREIPIFSIFLPLATRPSVKTVSEPKSRFGSPDRFRHPPPAVAGSDTTIAGDIPGMPGDASVTKLGSGTAIKVFDSSQLPNRKLIAHLKEIATANDIPFQLEVLPRGGTDAGAFQRAAEGSVTCTISIPSRYVHTTNEMCAKSDIQASVDLLAQFLREAGSRDYSYDME